MVLATHKKFFWKVYLLKVVMLVLLLKITKGNKKEIGLWGLQPKMMGIRVELKYELDINLVLHRYSLQLRIYFLTLYAS